MIIKSELTDLFYKSEKKSLKWEKYFPVYENLLSKYKNKKVTFVEVGILNGGSLEIWKKYFGVNSRIIGVDKNPDCKKFENDNFEIFIGSQSDPNFWKKFYNEVGNVDVILDDGGHTNEQQLITLLESINFINDGGIHIIEDVHTSYLKRYGNPNKYSFINFSKKTIDDINFTFPKLGKFNYSLNKVVHSIEFFESIVVYKVNRNLCVENKFIINDGIDQNFAAEDIAFSSIYSDFKKKYSFLYKFKFIRKILRIYSTILTKQKSKLLNKYFD
jgi:hypothetical protein